MRAVLDTNVLVSAALKHNSTPARAVRVVEHGGVLLKSAATERQLFDVPARPYLAPLIGSEAQGWLRKLMSNAEVVAITTQIAACRDPTDDKFLELAVSGGADVIVSGDADLLVLDPFRGIAIITPAVFVQSAQPWCARAGSSPTRGRRPVCGPSRVPCLFPDDR
jgi:putative PIN family toxin of toxin-antitoxin system